MRRAASERSRRSRWRSRSQRLAAHGLDDLVDAVGELGCPVLDRECRTGDRLVAAVDVGDAGHGSGRSFIGCSEVVEPYREELLDTLAPCRSRAASTTRSWAWITVSERGVITLPWRTTAPTMIRPGDLDLAQGLADQRRGLEGLGLVDLGLAVVDGVHGLDAAAAHVLEDAGDGGVAGVDGDVDADAARDHAVVAVVDQRQGAGGSQALGQQGAR